MQDVLKDEDDDVVVVNEEDEGDDMPWTDGIDEFDTPSYREF